RTSVARAGVDLDPDALGDPVVPVGPCLDADHVARLQRLRADALAAVLDLGAVVIADPLGPAAVATPGDLDALRARVHPTHRTTEVATVVAAAVAVADVVDDLDVARPELAAGPLRFDADAVAALQPGGVVQLALVDQPGVAVVAQRNLRHPGAIALV